MKGMDERGLLAGLPPALRARDFFLYLEGGRRLTDLWLWGGRAVLGHKAGHIVRDLKNAAERGLFAPLPHPLEGRFVKALSRLLPGRVFRVYAGEPGRLLEAAGPGGEIRDPALGSAEGAKAALWRPFLDAAPGFWDPFPALVPVLPGPSVLALRPEEAASFPPSELIPPALLAVAARAAFDLQGAIEHPSRQRLRRVEKALRQPGCPWKRRGIYLSLKSPEHACWPARFAAFLEAGFLIPPGPEEPLILPGALSEGLEVKLAGVLGGPTP